MQDSTNVLVGVDVGGTRTQLRAVAEDAPVADHVHESSGRRPHAPVAAASWPAGLVADALPSGTRPSALAMGDAELLVPAAGKVTLRAGRKAPLTVQHLALIGDSAVPALHLDPERPPAEGSTLPVLDAPRLRGRFTRIEVNSERLRAVPVYTAEGLSVRLVKR